MRIFRISVTPADNDNVSSPWQNGIKLMVELCDRKADYITIITFDPFYVDGKCALDAVSAGFVKRITAVNISMKILFCDRIKGDIRFFVECM